MAKKVDKTIDVWCRALLDLGRRNRMIHYRPSKRRSLDLTEPSLEVLFEKLVCDEKTLVFKRPIDKRTAPRTHAVLSLFRMLDHPIKVTVGDIDYVGDYENAQNALSHMRSQYRLAHEEQGCHILYVSFGFIEWRDGKGGAKGSPFVKSPLILVPVELLQDKPSAPFAVKRRDDDIVVNPSLSLAFEKAGIILPNFDETTDTLDEYLEKIEAMAEEYGWRILREASLGLLSFQKISMYRDLEANRHRLLENPFVRAMAGENEVFSPLAKTLPDSISYRDTYRVLPADSSQEDAIFAAKRGESFVMEGPPGTGKSQTITNIIAEKLAEGKKVLFVSGKNAALQVVYRRLEETGLHRFALALHSHRANKREIVNDLFESLSLKAPKLSENDERDLLSLDEKRNTLNRYREALHTPTAPLGYTPYECIGALIESNAPHLTLKTLPKSREDFFSLLSLANRYDSEREAFLEENGSLPTVLFGMDPEQTDQDALTTSLVSLGNSLVNVTRATREAGISLDPFPADRLSLFSHLAAELLKLPEGALQDTDPETLEKALRSLCRLREAEKDKAALEAAVKPSFMTFDHTLWQIETETLLRSALSDGVLSRLLEAKTIENLLENRHTLSAIVSELLVLNETLDKALNALAKVLGFPIFRTFDELFSCREYLPHLDTATYVDPTWNKDEMPDKTALNACRKAAATVISHEEAIVKAWRPDVFELDHKRLSEKYNTTVHGLFSFVTANSRREVKRLLATYTRSGDTPRDEEILALFEALSDRALALKRFSKYESTVKTAIKGAWRGVRTDFDKIERGFAYLSSLPDSLFPIPTPISAYLALPTEEKRAAYECLRAIGKALGSLDCVFRSVTGLRDTLDDCHNADILLTVAKNRLSQIEKALDTVNCHTKRPLTFAEIKALAERLRAYERYQKEEPTAKCENERFLSALDALLPLAPDKHALLSSILTLSRTCHAASIASVLSREAKNIDSALNTLTRAFRGKDLSPVSVKDMKKTVAALLEALPFLKSFAPLAAVYREFESLGMEDVLLRYESLKSDKPFENTLRVSVLFALLENAKDERDALKQFSRTKLSKTASTFGTLDTRFAAISRKRIFAKLAASMPSEKREWQGEDELSVLEHEHAKRRGFMPIRKLFAKIPNLLLTLKPCFMMSPLSVSYFLEKESYRFDTVIFDEASQLFPEDAIGAIMRADEIIIVGDSKQLPPTDFFSSRSELSDEEEEEDEASEIKPSILDAALAVLPKHKLLWHYRSRYESLIAFSNHKIYSGELVTFPSPQPDSTDCGIEYLYLPDGLYETGKGQNQKEAEAVVTMLREHILRHSEKSLGVIAFGKKQQKAIEDAVTAFRLDNPEYEDFFSEDRDEPFFIKNLENVQGDERDTIIFSIGYGKNQRGKFSMNFGPLTKLGGERRLNVAITRAKENIKLIGSILPSDFNLAATESEGAHLLRAYIDYALHKKTALVTKKSEQQEEADPFLDTLADFLTSKGYRTEKRYGTSQCRVELAVFHPDHKAAIAAIMTDGEAFRSTPAARDREHLRYAVLERIGWRVYTVYAAAFLADREKEEARLLEFLNHSTSEQSEIEATLVAPIATDDSVISDSDADVTAADVPYGFSLYQAADFMRAPLSSPADKGEVIKDRMRYLIEEEAPIHRELVYRRLAASFRSGKLTESVRKALDTALDALLKAGIVLDSSDFLWPADQTAVTVRLPAEGSDARPFEYVAKEELAKAMLVILKSAFGVTPDSLYHEIARIYQNTRMTPKIRQKCEEALFTLLLSERVRLVDGKIKLL